MADKQNIHDGWIPISKIDDINPDGNILVWQHNLSDVICSRFQRAVWYQGSHIDIYPLTHKTCFRLLDNGFYEGYDLEGDLCRITHFAIVKPPV